MNCPDLIQYNQINGYPAVNALTDIGRFFPLLGFFIPHKDDRLQTASPHKPGSLFWPTMTFWLGFFGFFQHFDGILPGNQRYAEPQKNSFTMVLADHAAPLIPLASAGLRIFYRQSREISLFFISRFGPCTTTISLTPPRNHQSYTNQRFTHIMSKLCAWLKRPKPQDSPRPE